jgi:hypothetical protein
MDGWIDATTVFAMLDMTFEKANSKNVDMCDSLNSTHYSLDESLTIGISG